MSWSISKYLPRCICELHSSKIERDSISPRRPLGRQQTKQRCKMCPLCWPCWWLWWCAVTIASIAQWRRFILKATSRHWASTHSDRHQSDMPTPTSGYFSSSNCWIRARFVLNNRGVTYQTDEKYLNNIAEYFLVGVVKLALYCYNTCFL